MKVFESITNPINITPRIAASALRHSVMVKMFYVSILS